MTSFCFQITRILFEIYSSILPLRNCIISKSGLILLDKVLLDKKLGTSKIDLFAVSFKMVYSKIISLI